MVSNIGDELSGAKFGSQLVKCVDKTAKIPWHTCRKFLILRLNGQRYQGFVSTGRRL